MIISCRRPVPAPRGASYGSRVLSAMVASLLVMFLCVGMFGQSPARAYTGCITIPPGCHNIVLWPGGTDGAITHESMSPLTCILSQGCDHVTHEMWLQYQASQGQGTCNNYPYTACWIEIGHINRAGSGQQTSGKGDSYFYADNTPGNCYCYYEQWIGYVPFGDYGNSSIFSIYNNGVCSYTVSVYDYSRSFSYVNSFVPTCFWRTNTQPNQIQVGQELDGTGGVIMEGELFQDNYWRGSGYWNLQGYNSNMTTPNTYPGSGLFFVRPEHSSEGGSFGAGCDCATF